jgi:hypothetical protein
MGWLPPISQSSRVVRRISLPCSHKSEHEPLGLSGSYQFNRYLQESPMSKQVWLFLYKYAESLFCFLGCPFNRLKKLVLSSEMLDKEQIYIFASEKTPRFSYGDESERRTREGSTLSQVRRFFSSALLYI